MKGLTEGRIVHYVMDTGKYTGEHRPAIVVKVWRDADGAISAPYPIQLVVFIDGTNDLPGAEPTNPPLTVWRTSVVFDETADRYGSWHWIEQA